MREEVYDIGGMHCAACSSAVERVTRKLPGVTSSQVNLPMNRLTICYDETQCTPEAIITKVEKAGFTASPHAEAAPKAPEIDGAAAFRTQKRQLILSAVFAGCLLVVAMGPMLGLALPPIVAPDSHPQNYALLQFLLALPVWYLGRAFFSRGYTALFHGIPNMDTLVAVSATASLLFSLVMTFQMADQPHNVHNLYFESSAVVIALVSVGKFLEASSQVKTKDAITRLMRLAPEEAILVDENGQWTVPLSRIRVGDTVLVKPGARVPLDGEVIDGSGSVNEAMLTGESLPVEKTVGCEVIGGSVSVDGALYVRVTRVGADTTLARIIQFVEEAQSQKAPIAQTADRVAGVFVPIVMGIALLAALIWLWVGEPFAFALKIFTTVLVIACPCAMGLATPTAIIVGTGLGAAQGILIRSGVALEITHRASVVVLDKTGTITRGEPSVTDRYAIDEAQLFAVANALEQRSNHPLSRAICAAAAERGLPQNVPLASFENISGRGLRGVDPEGRVLLVGNERLLTEQGVELSGIETVHGWQAQGKTAVWVARDGKLLGALGLADTLRDDAIPAIQALHAMGLRVVLLTGDQEAAAEYVGRAAGVDDVVAGVQPTQKAEVIQSYQSKGETVVMVGDGTNDAPALAQADVGCAIGSGSDIAIDSADIVLMKTDLTDVSRAIRLSRLTIRTIRQNLFWAFCYNVLGIPIAAGVLYPAMNVLLSPMIGGLAMSLSSLFVVTNALRLRRKAL